MSGVLDRGACLLFSGTMVLLVSKQLLVDVLQQLRPASVWRKNTKCAKTHPTKEADFPPKRLLNCPTVSRNSLHQLITSVP